MNLVLAIIPVLLLIILMAFLKMSGDKSSVISLVVTMLIAFFGFHFPMQLFRKSRQTLVFNKFKTCLKNSNTRKVQYYNI